MSVTRSWIAGRDAVLAVSRFCLDQSWVFIEVPGQSDFGKDGYVDIVTSEGDVTGICFAVQIKGGRSFRRGHGYRIDATTANRQQWAASTLPVIGIVWDPDVSRLFWADLTRILNEGGIEADLTVPHGQGLTDEAGLRQFKKYVGSVAHRHASILDLVSSDSDLQMAGVAASYHIGRTDGRALILLRRVLFGLDPESRRAAVWALASAVPHPDILGSAEQSPDPSAEALLRPALRWTEREVVQLLEMIDDENGISRGSFGQHVHQLLVMDPSHAATMEEAAVHAAQSGLMDVAAWALVLAVYWAEEDGAATYRRLVDREKLLADTWAAGQVEASLADFRELSLF